MSAKQIGLDFRSGSTRNEFITEYNRMYQDMTFIDGQNMKQLFFDTVIRSQYKRLYFFCFSDDPEPGVCGRRCAEYNRESID